LSKVVCSGELQRGNELCLERFGVECFAYVVFGGMVGHIQINSLLEQTWALNHLGLMKVAARPKAL